MRIQKYLRMCGVTSRRKAEMLVKSGKVSVNGLVIHDFIDVSDEDEVRVEGKEVSFKNKVYYMFNKPKGYITTKNDPQGRKTIFDLLDIEPDVFPIGRLDTDTEGLLLLTNDGEVAQRLLHPKYEVPRIYEALIMPQIGDDEVENLERGISLPYGYTAKMKVKILFSDNKSTKIRIEIKEGKKREIRRTFKFLGYSIISLKRLSFGPIKMDARLKIGGYRMLKDFEIKQLLEYVGIENETQHGSHRKTVEGG